MVSFQSMGNLFSMFMILVSHRCYCYPHKRELNNFPEVINILENGRYEQLKQTQILQNISSALREDESSEILQEQSSSTTTVIAALASQSEILASISASLDKLTKSSPVTARDCYDIATQGPYLSGPYTISTWDGQSPFKVYCDLESDEENSWIVIQRRFDGSVDFDRGWEEYKNGFGDLEGEFWLGLNKMYRLTCTGGPWQLRVELEDFEGNTVYAQYDNFSIASEKTNFQLVSIGQYNGTVKDSLTYHISQGFTTKDRDNDSDSGKNCAGSYGSWWHNSCYHSNLNGLYRTSEVSESNGIVWAGWRGDKTLKSSTMKIKASRQ